MVISDLSRRCETAGIITARISLFDEDHAVGNSFDIGELQVEAVVFIRGDVFCDCIAIPSPTGAIAVPDGILIAGVAGAMVGFGIPDVRRQQAVGFHAALDVRQRFDLIVIPISRRAVVERPIPAGILKTIWCRHLQEVIGVVRGIHRKRQAELLLVIQAGGLSAFHFCSRERREEHCREDRDDGDDYQEFDERKRLSGCFGCRGNFHNGSVV